MEDDSLSTMAWESSLERQRLVIGPVTVGEYAKIGAAAVVLDDIPAHTTAVGLPARVVRVHTPEEIERDTTIGGNL